MPKKSAWKTLQFRKSIQGWRCFIVGRHKLFFKDPVRCFFLFVFIGRLPIKTKERSKRFFSTSINVKERKRVPSGFQGAFALLWPPSPYCLLWMFALPEGVTNQGEGRGSGQGHPANLETFTSLEELQVFQKELSWGKLMKVLAVERFTVRKEKQDSFDLGENI